jgi:hypothetical protein
VTTDWTWVLVEGRKLARWRHERVPMGLDFPPDVEPSTIPDLVAAIYRLQGRNRDGSLSARIRELGAEQLRRRGGASEAFGRGLGS